MLLYALKLGLYLFSGGTIDNFIRTECLEVFQIQSAFLELLSDHLVLAVEKPFEPSCYLDLAPRIVTGLLLQILEDVLCLCVVSLAA